MRQSKIRVLIKKGFELIQCVLSWSSNTIIHFDPNAQSVVDRNHLRHNCDLRTAAHDIFLLWLVFFLDFFFLICKNLKAKLLLHWWDLHQELLQWLKICLLAYLKSHLYVWWVNDLHLSCQVYGSIFAIQTIKSEPFSKSSGEAKIQTIYGFEIEKLSKFQVSWPVKKLMTANWIPENRIWN